MKNSKGFTLIELIATITIMGIIMMIAAPNVTSMVDKNKRSNYINDAKKLVSLAKYKFQSTTNNHPAAGSCLKYNLNSLDKTELQNTPNDNGSYLNDYSYVVVNYDTSTKSYKYYVQLVEQYIIDGATYYRGVKYTDSESLTKENAKMMYVTETYTDKNSILFKLVKC